MGTKGSPGKKLGAQGPRSMGALTRPLSLLCRWYIYAIHGYFSEVMFTATWTFIVERDWKFQGVTSVWALFIYGTAGLVVEGLYMLLRAHLSLLTRGAIYTLFIYLWEFSTGYVLQRFGACPWDYSGFRFNFMGLITFEYCPFWFVGSLVLEKLVIGSVLRLRLDVPRTPADRPGFRSALKDN